MRRPTCNVRTLLAAAALTAFGLAFVLARNLVDLLAAVTLPAAIVYVAWVLVLPRIIHHREFCLERARRHAAAEERHRAWAPRDLDAHRAGGWAERVGYHQQMKSKWQDASRRPWQAVEPDAPAPPVAGGLGN